MLFSSSIFLFFFLPLVFLVYYMISFSRLLQNIWLFIVSLLFYAWGEPVYVILMILSIIVNWLIGIWISKSRGNEKLCKTIFIIGCILNIFSLFLFKYLPSSLSSINALAGSSIFPEFVLRLPIGISFYTFQAMSYVIDVYRRDTPAEKNPFYVGLYIAFFPQLIAGPIVRYTTIAKQIHIRKSSYANVSNGVCRFMAGFIKKVLLANNFAILADLIFNYSQMGQTVYNVPAMLAWLGMISYTLQIYFDFSAYSDMAIGLGKIFGFDFEENFNFPYFATSMQEFWRKWHISLTSWFREYVYFPLGGSRGTNSDTTIRNIFIVWFLTGIWHGAGLTFITWGLWHFVFQIAERFFGYGKNQKHTVLGHIYTLLVVNFGWVIFRAVDLYQAQIYFKNLFALNNNGIYSEQALFLLNEYWVFLLLGIIFSMPVTRKCNGWLENQAPSAVAKIGNICYTPVIIILFIISISYITRGVYNPFIYFNF